MNWLVPILFVFSAIQLVTLDVVFFIHMPKNLRGALTGTRSLVSNITAVIFIYIAGFQFDHVNKNAPFYICGFCDIVFAIALAVMLCRGAVAYN